MDAANPSGNGTSGRNAKGLFVKGNRCGKGNPYVRRTSRLRAELLRSVTAEDIRKAIQQLVYAAHSGDIVAIRELLDRTVGKSTEGIDLLARIEELENALSSDLPRVSNGIAKSA